MVLHRDQPSYYESLLSLDEIDRVLTTADLARAAETARRELRV